jgi:hypothetical protein
MWTSRKTLIQPDIIKFLLQAVDEPVSFRTFFELCSSDESFADFLTEQLNQVGYDEFFWELPPITDITLDDAFECVCVSGPVLKRLKADPNPFASQFSKATEGQSVIVFQNLSGDATLISPIPVSKNTACYAHFAKFLREGLEDQVREFWIALGTTALSRASKVPFWLSTAGLGVSWLHLRFDSRPKYYRYVPYKTFR